MISEYFKPFEMGGGEISAFALAKELVKEGFAMHVLTSWFRGVKKKEIVDGVVIHRLLKTGKNPSSISDNIKRWLFFEKSMLNELEKLNNNENFDIIHCMNITSIYAVKLKEKIRKKFILHVNSPVLFCPKGTLMHKDKEQCTLKCTRAEFFNCYIHSTLVGKFELKIYDKYNPFFIYIYRKRYEEYLRLIGLFDHYAPISSFMKERLLKRGIPDKNITIIYNIIPLERFMWQKQPKNKIKKILYIGEYSKPKGCHLLIDALKKIILPYEANFYGDGILRDYLTIEAQKHKLNVKIHGKVKYEDVPKIMQQHDIVVIPSLVGEAFCRVALEALAAGKSVIASNVGGVVDIVENKKTGYLFEPGDISDLQKKLVHAIDNKHVQDEIRDIIKKKFSAKRVIQNVNNTYKLTMKRKDLK